MLEIKLRKDNSTESLSRKKRKQKDAKSHFHRHQFLATAAEGADPTEMTVTDAVEVGAAEAGVGPLKPDGSAL